MSLDGSRGRGQPMNTKLKGVLAGCGYASRFHLTAWAGVPEVDILAVSSRRTEKAKTRAEEFGIPAWYGDYTRMLDAERPDFVDIATPPSAHLSMVEEAAGRGIHVLCQKPIATSLEELDRMIDVTNRHGVRFMVNENCRFQPWFRRIRALIDDGTLGRPVYAGFFSRHRGTLPDLHFGEQNALFARMDRLVLFELGVHYIDTLRYLLGEPDGLFATTSRVSALVDGEDTAIVLATCKTARAVIDLSWALLPVTGSVTASWGEYRLEGTGGSAHVSRQGVLRVVTDTEDWEEGFPSDSETIGYRNALAHFAQNVLSGGPFETDGVQTRKTMEYLFAAYESSRTGTPWRATSRGTPDAEPARDAGPQ